MADAGATVAGATALGGSTGFVVAALARDLGFEVDPIKWAESGAQWLGLMGLVALGYRALGVH